VVAVEQLALQGGEEALGHRVVQRVADAAHRGDQAGLLEATAERQAGVLTAVVRVMDKARGGIALGDGHVEGVQDQFGAQVVGHRPADDPAGEAVQHDRHIQPAFIGALLGDVGHP
jgi:hypothetical protein